jgi:hypothetical protein
VTDAHQMELLSRAYVQAVCALAGRTAARPDPDYGVDLTLRQIKRGGRAFKPFGVNVDFQLKLTTDATVTATEVVYDLDIRAYELLRRATRKAPAYLVLLVLPADSGMWLGQDATRLEIRGGAFWLSLWRAPAVDNVSTVRVRIPIANLFTPDALCRIMEAPFSEDDK